MTPPADDHSSTGPPDRQTLRLLERRFADDPIVATTEFDPDSYEPQLLRALLDTGRYPSTVEAVRIDVRWFENDDFSFHYIETAVDNRWECRWDCHPNPHNNRLHFHEPPTGDSCRDLTLESTHPLNVTATVLTAIDQRIDNRWAEREPE